jgi:undecaprenyl-diphosphatase
MLWIALVLGIVEGLTEFLPVSSTGHLILAGSLLGLEGKRAEVFEIFIQLGAVLAVVWEYRSRLTTLVTGLPTSSEARATATNLFVAFLPAAIVGLLLHHAISEHLFTPLTVALALAAGAVLIFVVEAVVRSSRTHSTSGISTTQALAIGLAQCASLWPGFSRSAATILGGMTAGLDRRTATEFSFLLAIPTLGAATVYDLLKNRGALEPGDMGALLLATVVSFLVAWVAIRWLIRWVATHDLRPFAWYRLALAAAVFLVLARR